MDIKKVIALARETAQSVKLRKRKDLSGCLGTLLVTQTQGPEWTFRYASCSPSTGEVETGKSLVLISQST